MAKESIDNYTKKEKIIYILLLFFSFSIPFLFYYMTLYKDLCFFDAGELVIASYTMGITHPTGYPLYILLTYPFVHIFPNPVFGSSLFSALCLSISCFFLFKIAENLLKPIFKGNKSNLINLSFVLFFSSNLLIWHWSIQPEVYSFHILLSCLSFYFFLKAQKDNSNYYLFFLFLGFNLSHHRISFYYLPIFLIGMILGKTSKKIINLKNFLFFILGFAPYLFMFVQAKMEPFFNWGNPSTLKNFFNHIMGYQYLHIFKISPLTKFHLNYLFNSVYEDIFFPIIIFSVIGLFLLILNKKWKIYFPLIYIMLLSILQVLFYEIGDIDPYFINFEFCLILFSLYFMVYFYKKFKWSLYLFLALALLGNILNFGKAKGSDFSFPKELLERTLFSLPENSVFFTSQGAIFYFPSLYLQVIEKKRMDIIVIDTNLLKFSWYIDFLSKKYQFFYFDFNEEFEEYKKLLMDFEKNKKVPLNLMAKSYRDLINVIIEKKLNQNKQVFATHEFVLKGYADTFFPVPCGIFFEILKEKGCYPCNSQNLSKIIPDKYPVKQKFVIKDLINLEKNFVEYRRKYEKSFCN